MLDQLTALSMSHPHLETALYSINIFVFW